MVAVGDGGSERILDFIEKGNPHAAISVDDRAARANAGAAAVPGRDVRGSAVQPERFEAAEHLCGCRPKVRLLD